MVIALNIPRYWGCAISATYTQIEGEYPAAANPCRNRPIRIIGKFWAAAIRIQPRISGTVNINKDFLLPNLDPRRAAAKPPNIAPSPNIPAKT